MDEKDIANYIPEDVLEEILEYEEQHRGRKKKHKPYPSSRDIVEAVEEAALKARGIHPDNFPELVLEILREKGFDTSHVNIKRIWRTYEKLVREHVIPDTLGVVV